MESKILNIDPYLQSEESGRAKAQALFGSKQLLIEVEDKFATFDLSGATFTYNFYIEIKDRQCKSDLYDDDLLEVGKAKAMKNVDKDGKRFYLNFFTDGVARLYCLNDLKLEDVNISNIVCPASSSEDKGERTKICYLLPKELAKTYKYKC
jgi:hypothetical protein